MHEIEVIDIKKSEEETILHVVLLKEFKEWFTKSQGMKRWNHKKFQSVFLNALRNAGKDYKSAKVKVEAVIERL